MNIGVKIIIYLYLAIFVYITFVNIYEMNKKLSTQKNIKQIKLNITRFLFFNSNKENYYLHHLKIVILEIMSYFLVICILAGFIVSLFVKDSITLIIYAILFVLVSALGIYTGYNKNMDDSTSDIDEKPDATENNNSSFGESD